MKAACSLAIAAFLASVPSVANSAERGTVDIVVAATFCTVGGAGEGQLALSTSIDRVGNAKGGMLLGVKTIEDHPQEYVLTPRRGWIQTNRAGAIAFYRGAGSVVSGGRVVARDMQAMWSVAQDGSFAIELGDRLVRGKGFGFVTFAEDDAPEGGGDTLTHEVGHWLGLYHVVTPAMESTLIVAASNVEGYPEIAGLFRDTADGETAHVHGHLDYLKQVGDPATRVPSISNVSFEGGGTVDVSFDDGREQTECLLIETNAQRQALWVDVLDCDSSELLLSGLFLYQLLPCPGPCRGTLFQIAGDEPLAR